MQEVVAALGKGDELVAVHRQPDVHIRFHIDDLFDIVYAMLVQASNEDHVEVGKPARHCAPWHMSRPQFRVYCRQGRGKALQSLTTVFDSRHPGLSLVGVPRGGALYRPASTRPSDSVCRGKERRMQDVVDGVERDDADVEQVDADNRTGVAAADVARERLRALDDAPLDEHVEVYEDVHRRLQEGLADLDEG